MKWLFFVANSIRTFKTEQGSVSGSGRAYNLSRQICIVSSSRTFVNNELTSNEHMISWLYVLAQSANLRVLDLELILGDGLKYVYKIWCQIVVVSIYRRHNRTKRTARLMNLRKAIEDTRGRILWKVASSTNSGTQTYPKRFCQQRKAFSISLHFLMQIFLSISHCYC